MVTPVTFTRVTNCSPRVKVTGVHGVPVLEVWLHL